MVLSASGNLLKKTNRINLLKAVGTYNIPAEKVVLSVEYLHKVLCGR